MMRPYSIPPIPDRLAELYEVHNFRHAAEVLHSACLDEFDELCNALIDLRITTEDLLAPGGNESQIPKKV